MRQQRLTGRRAIARAYAKLRERQQREAEAADQARGQAIADEQAAWDALTPQQRQRCEQLERSRLWRKFEPIRQRMRELERLGELVRQRAMQSAQPPIAITVNGQRASAKAATTRATERRELKPTPTEEAESRRFWTMLSRSRELPTPKLRLFRQGVIDGMSECNGTALRAVDDAEAAGQLTRDVARLERAKLQKLFGQLSVVAEHCNAELADRARLRKKGWAPRFLLSAEEKAQLALDEEDEPPTAPIAAPHEFAPRWEGVHVVSGGTLPLMP